MKSIKVQCPAKINLNLKVTGKRDDGFHNIESVMQTISLYDYLSISMIESEKNIISLSGNSNEIPYDERNLVYKAAKMFLDEKVKAPKKIVIYIEKNIPVSAGLAGGSTDAAGTLYGLNKLNDDILSDTELHEMASRLGSDLNVCLKGGCLMCTGRGEKISQRLYNECDVSLIKPVNLGISAKEAYTKFSEKHAHSDDGRSDYVNDLEWAVIEDYEPLRYIKEKYPSAVMTGSGSTYFSLEEDFEPENGFWVKNCILTTTEGVKHI